MSMLLFYLFTKDGIGITKIPKYYIFEFFVIIFSHNDNNLNYEDEILYGLV